MKTASRCAPDTIPIGPTSDDKYAYALDPSHPEFAAHLERLFKKLVEDFGYHYLKLDFLYAAAAEGIRHDPLDDPRRNTAPWAARRFGAAPASTPSSSDADARSAPLSASSTACASGRMLRRTGARRAGAPGEPGTAVAIDAILARSFMHRRCG